MENSIVRMSAEIVQSCIVKERLKKFFGWAYDKEREHDLGILRQVTLFRGLDKKLLRKLLLDMVEKEYKANELIFAEGDIGKALYIVLDGSVKIIKHSESGPTTLTTLGPGAYFGELALISESPRYASAVTDSKTTLYIMYKAYFDELIRGNCGISSRILLNMVESLSAYISKRSL